MIIAQSYVFTTYIILSWKIHAEKHASVFVRVITDGTGTIPTYIFADTTFFLYFTQRGNNYLISIPSK